MPLANVSTGLVAVGSPRRPIVALVGAPDGIDYARRYGVVEHWAMNGSPAASINSANSLTAVNAPTYTTGKVYAQAAQLTAASSQYYSLADNAAVSSGDVDLWLAGWAYLDSKGANRAVVGKGNANNDNTLEYLLSYATASDRWRFVVGSGSANQFVLANVLGSPSTATWYFLMAYHDAVSNLVGISVNGGAFDTISYSSGSQDTSNPLYIGAVNNGGSPAIAMDGRIGPVTFGKSPPLGIAALATEIRDRLYNSGAGRAYPWR